MPNETVVFSATVLALFLAHHLRKQQKQAARRRFVGSTASAVASFRAWESQQPDALFKDPLAEVLAGELIGHKEHTAWALDDEADKGKGEQTDQKGYERARIRGRKKIDGTRTIGIMAIRVMYVDNYLLKATQEQGVRQVVLLGAGMDTRVWRLDLPPGVKWFELDRPEVLKAKAKLLGPAGAAFTTGPGAGQYPLRAADYATVPIDLREDWPAALRGAGFDPALPTAWLLEGLLNYLDPETAKRAVAGAAQASAKGSRLFATCVNWSYVEAGQQGKWGDTIRAITGTQNFGLPDAIPEARTFFEGNGWRVARMTFPELVAREVIGPDREIEFDETVAEPPGMRYFFTTCEL